MPECEKLGNDLRAALADGTALCGLMRRVVPNAVPRAHLDAKAGTFFAHDNIAMFLKACDLHFEMGDEFKFSCEYLAREGTAPEETHARMTAVISCILTFVARAHLLRGLTLPKIKGLERKVRAFRQKTKEDDEDDDLVDVIETLSGAPDKQHKWVHQRRRGGWRGTLRRRRRLDESNAPSSKTKEKEEFVQIDVVLPEGRVTMAVAADATGAPGKAHDR